MITELTSHNSTVNKGKVWCETCPKTILIEEADGFSDLDQDALTFLMSTAERHERLHPKHKITLTIYERAPTNDEIRSGVA